MSNKKGPPFPNHSGKATWGDRVVPLEEFASATRQAGRTLSPGERQLATQRFNESADDPTPVEGPYSRIVVFGGIYNNHRALEALLQRAQEERAEAVYCLGDLGGFGPSPEKVWPLIVDHDIHTIQGNYEQSLASGEEDCNCGYTDPRDNHFAELSYRYTAQRCSKEFKGWMGRLPLRRRVQVGERELLLVHGSPRRINEFLFESTTPNAFLEVMLKQQRCDGMLCTHTGLSWHRPLGSGGDAVNVGVIGRPANDGTRDVRFCILEDRGDRLGVELAHLSYDHESLVTEMRAEDLPDEFVQTIQTGWWTTCMEILPARERAQSRY